MRRVVCKFAANAKTALGTIPHCPKCVSEGVLNE